MNQQTLQILTLTLSTFTLFSIVVFTIYGVIKDAKVKTPKGARVTLRSNFPVL